MRKTRTFEIRIRLFVTLTKYKIQPIQPKETKKAKLKYMVLFLVLGYFCITLATTMTWHEMGGVCYGLSSTRGTYTTSRDACLSIGSQIVQVRSYEIHKFLGSKMKDSEDYWVGLQYNGSGMCYNYCYIN